MATATGEAPKDEVYERIVLEPTPEQEAEIEQAKSVLDFSLCSMPEEAEGEEGKENADKENKDDDAEEEESMEKIAERTKKALPKGFPYSAYMPFEGEEDCSEEVLGKEIFTNYTGPVYWNDCGRDFIVDPNQDKKNFKPENMANLVYHSLKPIMIHPGGEKKLTVGKLCEGIAKLKFNAGDNSILENIDVQLREIDNKDVMTIVFFAGSD